MNLQQIEEMKEQLNIQRKKKYNEYHKRYYHKRVKKREFVSILDMEILPPVKKRTKLQPPVIIEPSIDSDSDNDSITSDITECSLINTCYDKSSHLKRLDNQLKDLLTEKGYDTQEQVANLFMTFKSINTKYGLPSLDQRTEHNLAEFYNNTIYNLK